MLVPNLAWLVKGCEKHYTCYKPFCVLLYLLCSLYTLQSFFVSGSMFLHVKR